MATLFVLTFGTADGILRAQETPSSSGRAIRLPDAAVKRSYQVALPLFASIGNAKCQVTTGQLPDGLALRGLWIRGAPTKIDDFSFSVKAKDDAGQTAEGSFRIEVRLPPAPQLTIPDEALPPCVVCTPYRVRLLCEGGYPPYTWNAGETGLPAGLKLQGNEISGVVEKGLTSAEFVTFQVQVCDRSDEFADEKLRAEKQLRLQLRPNPTIQFEHLQAHGAAAPNNEPTELPTAIIGEEYSAQLPIRGGYGKVTWTASSPLPPGLSLTDGRLSGVATRKASSSEGWVFSVLVRDEIGQEFTGDFRVRVVDPPPPPLEIVTSSLPAAVLGVPYREVLRANGGWPKYTWEKKSGELPTWAELKDGVISGIPDNVSTIGKHALSIGVEDTRSNSAGPIELTLAVETNPRFPKPGVVSSRLPMALVGDVYSASVQIQGGRPPYQVKVVDHLLPADLTVDDAGRITGQIQELGDWHVTVQVLDSLGQESDAEKLTVKTRQAADAPLKLGQFSPVTGVVGERIEFRIPVSGGVLPYTFSTDAKQLMYLDLDPNTGVLSGTPLTDSEWDAKIHVVDGAPEPSRVTGALHVKTIGQARLISRLAWLLVFALAIVVVLLLYRRPHAVRDMPEVDTGKGEHQAH